MGVSPTNAIPHDQPPAPKLGFARSARITHAREFQAVFAHKVRKSRGSLTVFVRPNGLGRDRLGLSIGKRVGNAVVRGRAKRLIREAFRLSAPARGQALGRGGYDLVVSSRPCEGYDTRQLKADEVMGWLIEAATACHREQLKRAARDV
ncbi:MAG: ribonuclease P protein component [Phycisphaerales bacterium]